ncbi:glycoside hydrolase, partial [Schizophyllum commune]
MSSFSRIASAALVAALGAASVRAHGIVTGVLVDGSTYYEAYNPFQDPYMNPVPDRVSRPVPGNGPIEDITSDDLRCNGGKSANLVATAGAGSSIDMQWTVWPDSHKGPVITYMAQVPASEDVKTWDPTDAVWFKVDEAGLEDGKWAATDIMIANNNTWTWQVPSDLAAGNYLVRHEIIALHSAGSYPGAQLYPMCLQLEVTGSGTSMASASDMVAFPGGYTPDTPGIVFDIYNGATDYPIPGPALWSG